MSGQSIERLQAKYAQGDDAAYAYGSCIDTHNPDHDTAPGMHMIAWCVFNRTGETQGTALDAAGPNT